LLSNLSALTCFLLFICGVEGSDFIFDGIVEAVILVSFLAIGLDFISETVLLPPLIEVVSSCFQPLLVYSSRLA
jgi:hypothetical protein